MRAAAAADPEGAPHLAGLLVLTLVAAVSFLVLGACATTPARPAHREADPVGERVVRRRRAR